MLAKLLDLDSPFQGRSLDAFDELMFDRDVVCSTHEVLVFKPVSSHPKKFKKKWRALLSCLDSHAQRRMMLGKRFPILILDESEEFDLFNLKNRRVKSRFFPKEFLTAVELGD